MCKLSFIVLHTIFLLVLTGVAPPPALFLPIRLACLLLITASLFIFLSCTVSLPSYPLPLLHVYFLGVYHYGCLTPPSGALTPPLVNMVFAYNVFHKRSSLLHLKVHHGNKRPFEFITTRIFKLIYMHCLPESVFLFPSNRHMPISEFPQKLISLFIISLGWVDIFFYFNFFYFYNQNHPTWWVS